MHCLPQCFGLRSALTVLSWIEQVPAEWMELNSENSDVDVSSIITCIRCETSCMSAVAKTVLLQGRRPEGKCVPFSSLASAPDSIRTLGQQGGNRRDV